MSAGKGYKNRLRGNEYQAWDNSELWKNVEKKKLEKSSVKIVKVEEKKRK